MVVLRRRGRSVRTIQQRLMEECITVSNVAVYSLLKKYEITNAIVDRPRTDFHRKVDEEKVRFVDEALAANDESTARQLLFFRKSDRISKHQFPPSSAPEFIY